MLELLNEAADGIRWLISAVTGPLAVLQDGTRPSCAGLATDSEAGDERTVEKRQRNSRGSGVRLKDEAFEAAMRLLDARPASELSLRMVAKEAGVTAPSLYRQFPDSNAMMREIVRECWRQMGAEMALASTEPHGEQPLDQLCVQMRAYVHYAMQRAARYQLLFALPLGADAQVVGFGRPVYDVVRATMEKLAAMPTELPARDLPAAVLVALSIAHGRIALAHLALRLPSNSPASVETFVIETIERLFGGRLKCQSEF